MDKFGGLFHYGTWIWWRYLTEKYTHTTGALPDLVLHVWRLLDGTPGAKNLYSTRALSHVLHARGTSLRRQFQLFSAANRHPATAYEEGAAPAYRTATPAKTIAVSPTAPDPAPVSVTRNHLTSATVRYDARSTDQRDWRLRLRFDLPALRRGSAADVLVFKDDGTISTKVVRLDRTGAATTSVPFSSASVRRVEVVLVDASARFDCWQNTSFSCQGTPKDDGVRLAVDARAYRG
jgi:hypothetical protein